MLDPCWRDWPKLWSLRLTIFWTAAANLWVLSPAVQYYVSPVEFAIFSAVALLGIIFARVVPQASTSL